MRTGIVYKSNSYEKRKSFVRKYFIAFKKKTFKKFPVHISA